MFSVQGADRPSGGCAGGVGRAGGVVGTTRVSHQPSAISHQLETARKLFATRSNDGAGASKRRRLSALQRGHRMGDFTKLAVWKTAHQVTLGIYRETSRWPKHELFGLTSQSRRAVVSLIADSYAWCELIRGFSMLPERKVPESVRRFPAKGAASCSTQTPF